MTLSDALFTPFSFLAAALYLASAGMVLLSILQLNVLARPRLAVLTPACIALTLHAGLIIGQYTANEGMAYDFFNMLSLVFLVIGALFVSSAFNKPIESLAIIVFPFSAAVVLSNLGNTGLIEQEQGFGWEIQSHILLSVLAYSLLTVAAFQAVMLSFQEKQLHNRHPTHFIRSLPPLQIMEGLLFQTVGLGVFLLTFSLATGFIFLEDIFAQHLVHKTALSISAWVIFSTLLWGRGHFGWRGQTAIKWTYSGYFLLLLAYFGSKFVLQLVLQQS
ncbi:MAG: ABC transporter permease [Cycloclasticus sp. symbiont of Poecilosclerida sp. M]|nr:MAG: ABC transporter permease [Cycloclasticus sp. symbiont of Poecilosclerida sp. M]